MVALELLGVLGRYLVALYVYTKKFADADDLLSIILDYFDIILVITYKMLTNTLGDYK